MRDKASIASTEHAPAAGPDASRAGRGIGSRIAHPQDLAFGLFLLALALAGYFGGGNLSIGTTVRMGPGFVPVALSTIVAGMGLVLLLRGFLGTPGERLEPWAWSKMAYILGAFIVFALTLERLGLVLAVVLLVVLASLGAPDRRWWEIAIFAPAAAFFAAVLFKTMLGIPVNLWPF